MGSLIAELKRNGWLDKKAKAADTKAVKAAVKRFQKQFGLVPTGEVSPLEERLLNNRFCGVPDNYMTGEARTGWSPGKAKAGISFHIASAGGNLPGMSEYVDFAVLALKEYPKVAGIKYVYTSNAKTADVTVNSHRERSGGVLAWSHIPSGDGRYGQSYDNAESWYYAHPYISPPSGTIGLWHVWLHEFGHMSGMPHGGDWLMRPTYDPRAYNFGKWETAQLRDRYGDPLPSDPEEPPPTNPGTKRLIVEGNFTYRVEGGGILV